MSSNTDVVAAATDVSSSAPNHIRLPDAARIQDLVDTLESTFSEPSILSSTGRRQTLASLKNSISIYRRSNSFVALFILIFDVVLFCAGQRLVILGEIWSTSLGSLITSLAIMRLFIVGHDACHGSFTGHKYLNKLIGRVTFLPSLTAYSLWHAGHNVLHHGFNNIKGRDFVWVPLSPAEFAALPTRHQVLYRVYRSVWGPALYYFFEIWFKRLWFPSRSIAGAQRSEFYFDSALTTVFAVTWAGWLFYAATRGNTSPTLLILFGEVVPYIVWSWTMGVVVYLHHTNLETAWFDTKDQWRRHHGPVTGTVDFQVNRFWGGLMHQIMDHQAHHLDPAIPLYQLQRAQQLLLQQGGTKNSRKLLSAKYYFSIVEHCKLYDYEQQCWKKFAT